MSIRNQLRRVAFAAAVGLLAAGSASAQLITSNIGVGNQFVAGGAPVPLLGMTTIPFFNNANQRFVVTFSAECAVSAPAGNTTAFTDIDIVVLNAGGVVVQTIQPTLGAADAFCTANGTPGVDGWLRGSATVSAVWACRRASTRCRCAATSPSRSAPRTAIGRSWCRADRPRHAPRRRRVSFFQSRSFDP